MNTATGRRAVREPASSSARRITAVDVERLPRGEAQDEGRGIGEACGQQRAAVYQADARDVASADCALLRPATEHQQELVGQERLAADEAEAGGFGVSHDLLGIDAVFEGRSGPQTVALEIDHADAALRLQGLRDVRAASRRGLSISW